MVGFQVRHLQTSTKKPLFSEGLCCVSKKIDALDHHLNPIRRSVDPTPRKVKKESGDILPTHQRGHYLLVTC